jgi:beta-N-acetylhexosaminidase
VPEAAVLALAAGCDALVVGGGLRDEEVVLEIARALAAGVPEERLAQAASRIEAMKPAPASLRVREGAALDSARRALCAEGDVHVGAEAIVITMHSPSSIAAGQIPWGIAESLAARGVRITENGPRLVVAVRDLHRQPDNQDAVDSLLAVHPDAIVVEMGVPVRRPQNARNYIATYGSARVCADAAAELMTR